VLRGINLEVPKQKVTFVVGRSGAGKSVLARCCLGLLRIDAGEIWVNEQRIDSWPEKQLLPFRSLYPYVVQNAALLDWLDILNNVAVPLRLAARLPRKTALLRAEETIAELGLEKFSNLLPKQVGPGIRKIVSIARALALRPPMILYDEPTTGLDALAARQVDQVIRTAVQKGGTALVISHDLNSVRHNADQVFVLENGQARCFCSVEFFLKQLEQGMKVFN
jgi:phospholipid/cholesterol/gamma-HCH transport system ATP-binding protein